MADFIAQSQYYKKLLFWDISLEPRRGPFPTSGERFGRDGAPFPTLPQDWISIEGEGVGFKQIKVTMRMAVGLAYDGNEILMSLYRHANSKPFHIYVIYRAKGAPNRVFGYDLSIVSVLGQEFSHSYPPLFSFNMTAYGRLMSEGRDFYVNGESLNLVHFDDTSPGCPNASGFFRSV